MTSSSPPRSPVNMVSIKSRPVSPESRSVFKSTPSTPSPKYKYRKQTKPRIINPVVTIPQQQLQQLQQLQPPHHIQPSYTEQQHSQEPRNLHGEHKHDAQQHNLLTTSYGVLLPAITQKR